ncbi:hypothetical protein CK203_020044 [Vitis vinifera]|uniref:Uncharacterized protein n=1 Tax=Vitis vinifera TaxID=29760 RepID=A0A438J8D7_VITVI|nr:hypothetical protein CK203_020044 [Vitis vinifera]
MGWTNKEVDLVWPFSYMLCVGSRLTADGGHLLRLGLTVWALWQAGKKDKGSSGKRRNPTAINHPKTSPNIDKSTFKCTHCNKTDPTSLDIPQFQSNDSWYDRKKMRNRGFEPWTFRSCLGYQHFVINDNNRDQRKKDSKKTSTATVAEIKTEANVAEKASALVAATDHGVVPSLDYNLLSVSQITAALSCIVIFWPEFCVIKDIQTRQMIGCGIKRGKLYYLDLQSKDSNKLQQALIDGSEGEKNLKFGCGIDVWDMLPLVI